MITESILSIFFTFAKFLMGLIPSGLFTSDFSLSGIISFLKGGLYFVNQDIFYTCISVFVSFISFQLIWSVCRFIYQKIPGIT